MYKVCIDLFSLNSYDLMFSCWLCEPEERPTFKGILEKLDYFLSHSPPNEIININFMENNKR